MKKTYQISEGIDLEVVTGKGQCDFSLEIGDRIASHFGVLLSRFVLGGSVEYSYGGLVFTARVGPFYVLLDIWL